MAILTRLPLRRRIMVLVAGGLGITLLAFAVVGYGVVAQSTGRVLQERLVMARVAAADLDERLRVSLNRLEGLTLAAHWDSGRGLTPEAQRLLDLSMTRRGLFSGGFIVLDIARRVVWPAKFRDIVIGDTAALTALSNQPAISDLILLPDAEPAAVMWVPLRDPTGRVIGILGGIIDLRSDSLTQLIAPLAFGRTGHALIVDRNGVVLAGTEKHELFTRGDHPDFFVALIRQGSPHIGQTPELEDGVVKDQHIMAFAPLTVGRWGLGFGQAEWEVFLPERQLQHRMLLLGLFLLALGLAFSWRDTGVITAPLRRLTRSAQRIAEGNLESPISPEPGHEVGMLAGALETMRSSLQRMHTELEQHAQVIEQRRREAQALYEVSTEILSEADLTAVLSTIASAARTLLGTDVSSVCLWDRERRRLVPGAFDGPPDAFRTSDGGAACEQISPDGTWQMVGECPFVRSDFRQVHVTASLRAGERLVGFMCVGCAEPRPFPEEDAGLLTALASLAAIAIDSAQLREQVQHLAVLEERERIGRDLHDSIIQSLYGIMLALEHSQQLMAGRPAHAAARLESAIETITRVIQDIRSYVLALYPRHDDDSVTAALERVVREFRANTLLPVEFRAGSNLPRLSADQRLHLQLLVREALANVARHAGASRVVVGAVVQDGEMRVDVTDDGRGFDVDAASAQDGLGLHTMAERARRMGGTFKVHTAPGAGTTVEVRAPLPAERSVPV